MTQKNRVDPHASRRRLWLAGTALTLLAAVGGAVTLLQAPHAVASSAPAEAAAVPVSVAQVIARDVAIWDEFSGRLEAVERVEVRPRVAGAVQAVHFREGSLVRKGDLLITLDAAPFEAEVARVQAQVAAAQARVVHGASERQRAERLWQDRAIAQRELDERTNAHTEALANLQAAQAALRAARLDLSYTQVRAPVAGRVGRLEVTIGNLVASGPSAPVLTTLVSVSPIYASFEADERTVTSALQALRGQPAGAAAIERIPVRMGTSASTDTPHEGRLQLVDNQVDARSGTVRVRAVFDNADGALMPGQFARLRLGQLKPTPALLINERAVGTDQDRKYVWVVGADGVVSWRAVTLGGSADGLRIVTAGLKPDEQIVVNGLQRVRPGVRVDPKPVAMEAGADLAARPQRSSPAS